MRYPFSATIDQQIIALWEGGEATRAAAAKLKISHAAFLRRAHKLGLSRPSPLKGGPRKRAFGAAEFKAAQKRSEPRANIVTRPRPVALPPRYLPPPTACCWPIGEPRTAAFRYCDAPGEPGLPYCADHCAVAYPGWLPRAA